MKVSGFSFVKNGIKFDYPFVEAIRSILPICDNIILAVGDSEDSTLTVAQNIDSKVKIIETVWDSSLLKGGQVLAQETDKAKVKIPSDSDWAIYIQGDEVIHEQYLDVILAAMKKYCKDDRVDGLLFKYLHFYGSYDYIGTSSNWYTHEIRVIKNNSSIYSYLDAQGFRKGNNQKLNVVPIDAYIYHYGWVRPPKTMSSKHRNFITLYTDKWAAAEHLKIGDSFDYKRHVKGISRFEGSHPAIMRDRIMAKNWDFDPDMSTYKLFPKDIFKNILKKYTGIDVSYRNYNIIAP